MQIGCLAVGFESEVATLTKRVAKGKAALQAKRVTLVSEREKAHKLAQTLKATIAPSFSQGRGTETDFPSEDQGGD